MRKITQKEMRQIQLEMLAYIDKIAREHQIEYSLGGGSLLGAMRHKGFIPWDDDIDLMLERSNYERLMQVLADSKNEDFKLLHHSTEQNLWPFAKLYHTKSFYVSKTDRIHPWTGLFIDIFPIDKLPNSQEERNAFFRKVRSAAENLKCSTFPNFASGSNHFFALARLILGLPRFILYHGKAKEMAEKADKVMSTFNGTDAKYRGYTDSRYRLRECFPAEIFDSYEDIAFECLMVRKIKDDKVYLNQLYGTSYMELPPENKRESHDYYTWYWKE